MMNGKQQGFTLAEMLIALTLIGIIAAMLVPKLLQNTNEKTMVAKAKTMMSTIDSILVSTADPDADISQTFPAYAASKFNAKETATGATALASYTATATTGCAPNANGRSFLMNDNTVIVIAGTEALNVASPTSGNTTVCVDLNSASNGNTNDVYWGTLTSVGNSSWKMDWSTAPTGNALTTLLN